ncbi:MAG: prepilin-type N-terminal cleavage/methylation domain-containing protein [bacterium]
MRKHSFTLIEMLIVVVIIGILAAALIPRLQSVQARARDTKRKADLHQVATALEIYREDNGNFKEFARRDNCNLTHYIINPGQYSSIMRGDPTDMQDNTWFAYQVLSKYMTTVPSDSDVSPRQSDGCTPIY